MRKKVVVRMLESEKIYNHRLVEYLATKKERNVENGRV